MIAGRSTGAHTESVYDAYALFFFACYCCCCHIAIAFCKLGSLAVWLIARLYVGFFRNLCTFSTFSYYFLLSAKCFPFSRSFYTRQPDNEIRHLRSRCRCCYCRVCHCNFANSSVAPHTGAMTHPWRRMWRLCTQHSVHMLLYTYVHTYVCSFNVS